MTTTHKAEEWHSLRFKFPAWLRWLERFIDPTTVEVIRFWPGPDEIPTAVTRRALSQGYRYCDESTLRKIIHKVRSRKPGFLIAPREVGSPHILKVETTGKIRKVDPATFHFVEHPGRWLVIMIR